MKGNLRKWVAGFYRYIAGQGRGVLEILRRAIQSLAEARAAEAAASLAYFALFSLFPFLLTVIVAGSFFLESRTVLHGVVSAVAGVIPVSHNLIVQNVEKILERRQTIGVVGLAGLLWSATSFFSVLARSINRAWPGGRQRNFVRGRLVGLGMVAVLALLLVLSLLSNTVLGLLPYIHGLLVGNVPVYKAWLWIAARAFPWLLLLLLFLNLYRWIPRAQVKWWAAFWGALVAVLGLKTAASVFTWYLGIAHYELVYGSLGTVVALMLWIYISSLVILLGAHLSAAVMRQE
ncbi:MAG: YihY/virulence factor BrkB family protein [Anaerolineae bacterium]|nr:YihY/virulence factor BrkB family protein [Anaerolineae bacterium]